MRKTERMEHALRKIRLQTTGYDHLSRLGWINILAREALGDLLTSEEQRALKVVREAEQEASQR